MVVQVSCDPIPKLLACKARTKLVNGAMDHEREALFEFVIFSSTLEHRCTSNHNLIEAISELLDVKARVFDRDHF